MKVAFWVEGQRSERSDRSILAAGKRVDHALLPAVPLRGEFENHAQRVCPAVRSCAVKIAVRVEHQRAARSEAVIEAREIVKRVFDPGTARERQLKDDAATIASAQDPATARHCCSIEISSAVECDAAVRIQAVDASGEAIEYGLLTRRRDLEDRPKVETATRRSRAVSVA